MTERHIGIDTSFYAQYVNYNMAVEAGAKFAVVRAGQGEWIDNYFQNNMSAAKGLLPRSAYWFFDDRYKPSRQVDLLRSVYDPTMEGYIWVDYELDHAGASYAGWTYFHDFLRVLEERLPEMIGRIGIYTRYYYWKDHVPSDKWYLFEKYPFWEARYKANEPFNIPFPALLWQYTESGDAQKYGLDPYVKKAIDLNYFMGTDEEWEHFTGGFYDEDEEEETPEPTPSPDIYDAKVMSRTGVNIRMGRGIDNEKVGALWAWHNIKVSGVETDVHGNTWAKLEEVYVATEYGGMELINVSGQEEPDDPDETGHSGWLPDPNRPEELYYARHGGYKRIKIHAFPDDSSSFTYAEFSEIFLGDEISPSGRFLHVILGNGEEREGWIDLFQSEMVWSRIPDEVLASPIPQKTTEPKIFKDASVPSDGTYLQILWDKSKNYNTPQPDTFVLFTERVGKERYGWVQVPPKWQWFIFDLLKMDAPGMPIVYYIMAYAYNVADNRAFTDLKDKDLHRDVILGLNPEAEDYWWKWSITTRGNVIQEVGRNGAEIITGGLDITKDPPPVEEVYNMPHLVHKATQVYPKVLPNSYPKSVHFPTIKQMVGGKEEKTGTSIPFFKSPYWISTSGMSSVQNGQEVQIANLSRWL